MMDVLSNVRFDPEILKEPRGFMRIVQFVLSIFAFATVTSVQTETTLYVWCTNSTKEDVIVEYGYPFRIHQHSEVDVPFCSDKTTDEIKLNGNFSSSAEFFCFVGVISFLACLILLPAYVFLGSFFTKDTLTTKADFISSTVWTLVWFIASVAWADNVSKIIAYMDPKNVIEEIGDEYCHTDSFPACVPVSSGDHSTLITSVLFGFLNFGLHAAALWFLFKETDWHKDKSGDGGADAQADFDQPYADPGYQTPEYNSNPSIPTTPTGGATYQTYGNGNDYYGSNMQSQSQQHQPMY